MSKKKKGNIKKNIKNEKAKDVENSLTDEKQRR